MSIPPSVNINKPVDIIDLDTYVCNDEKIQIWLKRVFDKIKVSFGFENQNNLETLMKWYIDSLHTDVIDIVISRTFSIKLEKHIFLFHRIFKRFNYFSFNTYLDYMEDILAFYLDCEVKRFINEKRRQKKNKQFMRSRILNLLNVYLLDQKDRYHHVLMKMRADISSDEAKNCLDNIYRVLFAQKPSNKSDQAFCTAFILSERWKKTLPADCWPTLEELIKELYGRHPNTIQTNPVWKEITSSNESFIETIAQFHVNDRAVCDAYFKYAKSKSMDESQSVVMVNKDTNPTEEPSTSRIGINQVDSDGDGESELENILKNCKVIEALERKNETTDNKKNVNKAVEDDDDDDDDCIIVSDGPLYVNPEDLVLEILDDDDDVNEDIKDNTTHKEVGPHSSRMTNRHISFLDSIDNIADISSVTNDNSAAEDVSSPLLKSQGPDEDDSVKLRDILSPEVAQKKDDKQKTNNISETVINNKEELDTNDNSNPNSSVPEDVVCLSTLVQEKGTDELTDDLSNSGSTNNNSKPIKEECKKRKRSTSFENNTVCTVNNSAIVSPQYMPDVQEIPLSEFLDDPSPQMKPLVMQQNEIEDKKNLSEEGPQTRVPLNKRIRV